MRAVHSPPWLAERQGHALRRFRTHGILSPLEEWKYTDLRNALEAESSEVQRRPSRITIRSPALKVTVLSAKWPA